MDKEKIAEELYDWEGRYGGHGSRLWQYLNEEERAPYLAEAEFILEEFVENTGYRKQPEVPLDYERCPYDGDKIVFCNDLIREKCRVCYVNLEELAKNIP